MHLFDYSFLQNGLLPAGILSITTMMNIAGYSHAGKYKEYDNNIIEEDKNGRRRVRFHPTPAADTPVEME